MLQFQQCAQLLSSCTSALSSYLCRDFLATQKNVFGVLLKNWFQNQGKVRRIGRRYPERLCSELFYPWKFSRHNCIKPWATLVGICFARETWSGNQMSSLLIELFYDSIKKKKKKSMTCLWYSTPLYTSKKFVLGALQGAGKWHY